MAFRYAGVAGGYAGALYAGRVRSGKRTGPAIWLRCVVDRTLPDAVTPEGTTPILYLPRVSRAELLTFEQPDIDFAGTCSFGWSAERERH